VSLGPRGRMEQPPRLRRESLRRTRRGRHAAPEPRPCHRFARPGEHHAEFVLASDQWREPVYQGTAERPRPASAVAKSSGWPLSRSRIKRRLGSHHASAELVA
jgi:hypothetical protein